MNSPSSSSPHWSFVLFGILAALALLATGFYLVQGRPSSGDLYQHHAAGTLWAAGEKNALYRGNVLGARIDAWQTTRFPDLSLPPRDHFNYLYPPLCAVITATLSGFSFTTWTWAWLAVSITSTILAIRWCYISFPGASKNPLLLLSVIAFPPLHYALYIGQVTPVTLLILAGGFRLLTLKRPLWAGFAVSLLFYKPQLLPWIGLFMLFTGSWRFIAGVGVGSFCWLGIGLALAGVQAHLDWIACLRDMAGGLQFTRSGVNLSLRGMLEFAHGGTTPWTNALAIILGIAGLGWAAFRHRQASGSPAAALALGTALCQVFSPYVCHYDYLLVLPWLIAAPILRTDKSTVPPALFILWLAGLVSIAGILAGWPYAGLPLAAFLLWTLWPRQYERTCPSA